MSTATITAKGQITIPKQIREALELQLDRQVVFVIEEGKVLLHPVHRQGIERLRGIARGRASFKSREAEREAAMSLVASHAVDPAHE